MIVLPDADLVMTTSAIMSSAFGCSGQRCMAGSMAVAVGKVGNALIESLDHAAAGLRVGPTDSDDSVAMDRWLIRPPEPASFAILILESRKAPALGAMDESLFW